MRQDIDDPVVRFLSAVACQDMMKVALRNIDKAADR
jgi:hypothetical protein